MDPNGIRRVLDLVRQVQVLEDPSKSASDDCTSVETCSIEPIGKNSRDCRVVNPTSIPAAVTSDPEFELTQPATRYTRAGVIEKNVPTSAKKDRPMRSSGGAGSL